MERSQVLEKRAMFDQIKKVLLWALILTLINSGLNATIFITRNSRISRMFHSIDNRKVRWKEELDMGSLSPIAGAGSNTPTLTTKNSARNSPAPQKLENIRIQANLSL